MRRARHRHLERERNRAQRIIASYEREAEWSERHHLYADAADRYQDALNVHGIRTTDRLRISGKHIYALLKTKNPGVAVTQSDQLLRMHAEYPESSAGIIKALLHASTLNWIESKTTEALKLLFQAQHIAIVSKNTKLLRYVNLGLANKMLIFGRYEEAERFLHEARAARGDSDLDCRYWTLKGLIDTGLGKESDAMASFKQGVAFARDDANPTFTKNAWREYGLGAMRFGRMNLAKACYERVLFEARHKNLGWQASLACFDYAELLMRMGQEPLAREYVLDGLSYEAHASYLEEIRAWVGIPLALHLHDEALLARCFLPQTIDSAFQSGEPGRLGSVCAAFARLYAARNQLRKARTLLHRALIAMPMIDDTWDLVLEVARTGSPADLPMARRLLEARASLPSPTPADAFLLLFDALVEVRQKQHQKAQTYASKAMLRFDELQLKHYAEMARGILPHEQHSMRTDPSSEKPFAGIETLTEREREIAALVLKGLTSRAIGDLLAISPHTVDAHVNSIMNRLDLRSRRELAYVL